MPFFSTAFFGEAKAGEVRGKGKAREKDKKVFEVFENPLQIIHFCYHNIPESQKTSFDSRHAREGERKGLWLMQEV
jgi:hypothetical protein